MTVPFQEQQKNHQLNNWKLKEIKEHGERIYKMEETQKPKEKDFASEVEINIIGIDVKTSFKDSSVVEKIILNTSKGNITYKPKIDTEEFREGMKFLQSVSCTVADIPQKIKDMAKECQDKGICKVKASYSIWRTEKDNEPVEYRFILNQTILDKWTIIREETSVESVA